MEKHQKISNFLSIKYSNMKSRVLGKRKKQTHLYEGIEICSKDDFKEWAINDSDFNGLYKKWVKSGFDKKLTPSIDRIDNTKGYIFENMKFITHSENSIKANKGRKK